VPVTRLGVTLAVLLACGAARAQDLKDRFNIRLSLTGFYLGESQNQPENPAIMDPAQRDQDKRARTEASHVNLAYGDLRVVMDARRLPGKFELHLDGRLRLTGDWSYDVARVQGTITTARGYYGGREYELREAYARRRGENADFAIGRMFVVEADLLKIDGLRFWYRFARKKWDLSLYAGGYPNPFSRSVTTDYQGSDAFNKYVGSRYFGPAIAAGADVSYVYDKFWGSLAFTGSYLGGQDDGGPVVIPMVGQVANPGNFQTELSRIWLTWNGYERFVHWLDIYHSLVLDVYGSAGVQLTRLDALATARAHKYFSISAGYNHLSPLAIEMYLTSLLTDRNLFIANTINNNLVVARTARDQGKLNLDFHYKLMNVFAEGRVRFRSLQNTADEPQFKLPDGSQAVPGLAYDATLGFRDRGSLKGVRLGLWYTYLGNFRSLSHLVGFELGRSFFEERFGFDFNFLYARTRDQGATANAMDTCNSNQGGIPINPMNPAAPNGLTNLFCYGRRDGNSYELGVTLNALPSRRWYLLLDYRLVLNDATLAGEGRPFLLTNVLLFRIEARY
jgi:hypothetical protein